MFGWSGLLCLFFFGGKGSNVGDVFTFFVLFIDFLRLEVTFWGILVSLGRLWTRLVPGGVQGGDLVEIVRSSRVLLAPFWSHFWSKTIVFLRCFVRCFFEWFVNGC